MKTAVEVLEEEMADRMASEISREIDREILWGMLVGMGWHRVMLTRFQDNKHAVDISYWLEDNIKNPFERNGRDFIFQEEKDAMLFILRWAS